MGVVFMLEGEAAFGSTTRCADVRQLVLLGPGDELAVSDAASGARFMLMAGKPYGETPRFNARSSTGGDGHGDKCQP